MNKVLTQLDETLAELKDFQKATVQATLKKYADPNHSSRVLVADEVGLGKTIVAKGIIAELLKAQIKNDKNRPLVVTYICSNLTLANENQKKLAVLKDELALKHVAQPSFGRLVELAVNLKEIEYNPNILLEVNSLTPSTSFKLTSGNGNMWERYIILQCLLKSHDFTNEYNTLSKLFQTEYVSNNSWNDQKERIKYFSINSEINNDFLSRLDEPLDENYQNDLRCESLKSALQSYCKDPLSMDNTYLLRTLVRVKLAKCCAKNLRADLFILDEFQRFQSLLDTDHENEEALIAQEIFSKKENTKILLLSATPFKALSRLSEDQEESSHHKELRRLLEFLSNNDEEFIIKYENEREKLLSQILNLKHIEVGENTFKYEHKTIVEGYLSNLICRTERSQISDGFDKTFDAKELICGDTFAFDEITSFKAIDQLGQAIKKVSTSRSVNQLLEFYKAAPWALSFLSGYQFKKSLDKYKDHDEVRKALTMSSAGWISRKQLNAYKIDIKKDAPNAKLKALIDVFFDNGGESLLWVPPSMNNYKIKGKYEINENFSKSLLFSSWALVPRALSGLISYEAERRIFKSPKKHKYFKDGKHTPKLLFQGDSNLANWSLAYPSKILKEFAFDNKELSINELITIRTNELKLKYSKTNNDTNIDISRKLWYALAPMLLDLISEENKTDNYVFEWLYAEQKKASDLKQTLRVKQLNKIQFHLEKNQNVTSVPSFICRHLAELSIASPGVCYIRITELFWPKEENKFLYISEMVFGTISMFNKAESEAILHKKYPSESRHWKKVLSYCMYGNFQAMIDEYSHLLATSGFSLQEASQRFVEVLGVSSSNITCQFQESNKATIDKDEHNRLRCHYAVPLGTQKLSNEDALNRVGNVRDAFNSPFRPFVLNSTSIGQEGLDFHWYCSRVIHWNLPSNPIDIEQREGRVNRFKSLVVRRRVVEAYGSQCEGKSFWTEIFSLAEVYTQENRESDLVPFWYFPEGKAKIERIVPMMPMSREIIRLKEALKILALYRLAFGQPRQEELLANLLEREMNDEQVKAMMEALVINLAPIIHQKREIIK